jgi:photosystem I subunit X
LFTPTLLAIAVRASDWSPTIGIIMLVCNIIAIAFGKFTIKQPAVGGAVGGNMFGGFGLGAILGTTCFGHILGAGTILGLTNMGVI